MGAHGYKVTDRPLAKTNDLTDSGTFGYGEGSLFDAVALELANFGFEVSLRLVPERDADVFVIDRVVILHAGVAVDRDLVGPEQKDFQF